MYKDIPEFPDYPEELVLSVLKKGSKRRNFGNSPKKQSILS